MKKSITTMLMLAIAAGGAMTVTARDLLHEQKRPAGLRTRIERQKQTHAIARVPDDGREYSVVLEEDFSLCTAGSEENPDRNYIEQANYSIPSKYTHTPGWSGRGIMQAGGAICIGMVDEPGTDNEMTGQIETPVLDLSRDKGNAYLTFRAKPMAPDVEMLSIRWATDELMGSTGELTTAYLPVGKWSTVEVPLTKCPENSIIQIWPEYHEVLIDDIKIEMHYPEIDAPKARKWTDYTGDSFTANWDAVEGADHYVINVFWIRQEGSEDQLPDYRYVVKEQETRDNFYHVEGLDPDKVYYYYVRAVKENGVESDDSQTVEVLALTVPKNISVTESDFEYYSAQWDAVKKTQYYSVETLVEHTAQADEDYPLLDENFNKLPQGGTMDNPFVNTIGYYDMNENGMSRANWELYEGGFIDGAICLHNTVFSDEPYYGELVSPILICNNSTGDITIEGDFAAKAAGVRPYIQIAVPGTVDGQTTWVLGAGGEVNADLNSEWQHLKLDYKVKPGITRFSIGTNGNDWMFIDNLKITCRLPKDGVQMVPYNFTDTEYNDITCRIPDRRRGDRFSFAVKASYVKPGFSFFPIIVTSDWSELVDVPEKDWKWPESGVSEVADASGFTAIGGRGELAVDNPAGSHIIVMDMTGARIATISSTTALLRLPAGVYILSDGIHTTKTMVR